MDEKEKRKLLGMKIQKLRKYNNFTQEAFCALIGIEPSSLSKIENGKYFPSLTTFIKIAEVCNISCDELLDVKHLKDNQVLENEMIEIIRKEPIEKKRLLYILIQFFKE